MPSVKILFGSLIKLVGPIAIGIVLTAGWNAYEKSKPRLAYSMVETPSLISMPNGDELTRYELEIWHSQDYPVSNVALTIKNVPGLSTVRIHLEEKDTVINQLNGEKTSIPIAGVLQVQKTLPLYLDINNKIEHKNIVISSDQILGSEYIPIWKRAIFKGIFQALVTGLIVGLGFFFGLNSIVKVISGRDLFGKLVEFSRQQRDLTKESKTILAEMKMVLKEFAEFSEDAHKYLAGKDKNIEDLKKVFEKKKETIEALEKKVNEKLDGG